MYADARSSIVSNWMSWVYCSPYTLAAVNLEPSCLRWDTCPSIGWTMKIDFTLGSVQLASWTTDSVGHKMISCGTPSKIINTFSYYNQTHCTVTGYYLFSRVSIPCRFFHRQQGVTPKILSMIFVHDTLRVKTHLASEVRVKPSIDVR